MSGQNAKWRERSRRVSLLLFPPQCVICGQAIPEPGRYPDLCPGCVADLPWRPASCRRLPLLDTRSAHYLTHNQYRASRERILIAAFYYDGKVPGLLRRLKFHEHLENARPLAICMADVLRMELTGDAGEGETFLIVPMPLAPSRLRERGYNQASELARPLSEELGRDYSETALRRVRETRRQSELDFSSRLANLSGAFSGSGELRGRRVIVLDDIASSGATLNAALAACEDEGTADVCAAVIASGRSML